MLRDFVLLVADWSALSVFLRLCLACIVGILIGIEREYKNKGAGMKTHVLVCVGSAVAMIVSEYLLHQFPEAQADLARIGAQVISGVGFLGVGTIIITGKHEVQGLTTAAGLWVCACIGLAAGAGYVEGTLIALFFVIFTHMVLNRIDHWLRQNAKIFSLYVEFEDKHSVKQLIKKLHTWNCTYSNFQLVKAQEGKFGGAATFTIELDRNMNKKPFIDALEALEFISFVEEIN